jgi:hypothetical protein
MKAVDSEFDRELLPEIKDLVWVDTVGWDDADLQGELTFCTKKVRLQRYTLFQILVGWSYINTFVY